MKQERDNGKEDEDKAKKNGMKNYSEEKEMTVKFNFTN